MSSSTGLGGVVDECAWWAAELVVECDRGGECEEAAGDASSEAVQGAGSVTFEGEDVLCRPVDRLDALTDWGEVRPAAGLVFAARAHDHRAERSGVTLELAAGVALVADDGQRP